MKNLADQLREYKAEFLGRASQQTIADYDRGVEEMLLSGILDAAAAVGNNAPEFTLANASGEPISLSGLLSNGPVVLTWYRGGWCPYCNLALKALQTALPEIKRLGATLVALTPETPDNSLSTSEKHALEFEVLSDIDNRVARSYGLVYRVPDYVLTHFEGKIDIVAYNGNEKYELPLTATYVVDQDGQVAWRFLHHDYRVRAEPRDIIDALERLTS